MSANRLGEVLETSTTEFLAGCDNLNQAPPFGTLVKAAEGGLSVLGLVYSISTASADPGRPAIVRGKGAASVEDVYQDNPQLSQLLRTDILVLTVGFIENGDVRHYLPGRPPPVHAFVYPVEENEQRMFFQRLDFLSILVSSQSSAPVDELIAACLRNGASCGGGDELLVRAGRELVLLLRGDPIRLGTVLRRLRP